LRVITDNSVWNFDEDSMMYSRFPRNGEGQVNEHPNDVSYHRFGKPAAYRSIEFGMFYGYERYKVETVDSGTCYTGRILEVVE
jgi:hypothetical protein